MDAKESAKEDDLPFGFFCKLLCLDLSVVEVVLWSCHCRHKNVNRRIPGKFISEENAIQWMQNFRPVFVLENQIIPFFSPCWLNPYTPDAPSCFIFPVKPKEVAWF